MSAPVDELEGGTSAPRAATGAGAPLRAELQRLRHRRLVVALLGFGLVLLLGAGAIVFATHGTDVAGARAKAQVEAQRAVVDQRAFREQCLADPTVPEADREAACGPADGFGLEASAFYQDPRLFADQALPGFAFGVAIVGALLMGLVGATAVGADWSTRAVITLLTWQPRRLRWLGTRLTAVALLAAATGVVAQALGLGLGALLVATRGTFAATPTGPDSGGDAVLDQAHFWRDLVLLQGRGVVLVVVFALLAACLATVTRSTGGFLGVALGWFVGVEVAGQGLLVAYAPGLAQWTLTQNAAGLLTPGGVPIFLGEQVVNGSLQSTTRQLTNLAAFWHLGVFVLVAALAAGVLLRRRDL